MLEYEMTYGCLLDYKRCIECRAGESALLIFYAQMKEAGAPPEELTEFHRQPREWIPAFCGSIERATCDPYFREIARDALRLL